MVGGFDSRRVRQLPTTYDKESDMNRLEDANYFTDHRVAALASDPWFIAIHPKGNEVAVKMRTGDWHWLADHGYDPDDFDGAGQRPMVVGEWVPGPDDCRRCMGSGRLLVHERWRGITLPYGDPGSHHNASWVAKYESEPERFELHECWDNRCDGGRRLVHRDLDQPRIHEDAEDRVYVPYRMVVFPCTMAECPTCRGRGRHVNPSVDCMGISSSEFQRDPDFAEAYFSGVYDVTCYECEGSGRVPAIDLNNMCPEDREVYDKWRRWRDEVEAEEAAYRAERAAEIRMGY